MKNLITSTFFLFFLIIYIADVNAVPVNRGDDFFGSPEQFNRYYTDSTYQSTSTLFVSPTGNGNGTVSSPMSVSAAFNQVSAGKEIRFLSGEYNGCWGLDEDISGTYSSPIVLKADTNVVINCCNTGRKSCFNLENSDYVAVDGFHLKGGDYGVRTVGGGYASNAHQKGVALLNNHGENQRKDPFFSGGSDWIVVDNNIANNAGSGDGHGIYLSNGGDWMIVRNNHLYNNTSSDLQINADPISTCADEGIPYNDARCDGSALEGKGQGVSEFVLFENNYLHNSDSGPNFTSVRNSIIHNNIIGFYSRHGTSFWQETNNPNLGSSNNIIEHNLFIGNNNSHVLQLINNSGNNNVRNNVLLGLSLGNSSATANTNTLLVEQDNTTKTSNTFNSNYYVGGHFENYTPTGSNQQNSQFNTNWFNNFPLTGIGSIVSFKPTNNSPYLDTGNIQSTTLLDIIGTSRVNPVDLGPWSIGTSTVPLAATLISPTGSVNDNTPTYSWNAVSNSSWYYLWVNDSSGNKIKTWYTASQAGCSSGSGTCSITPNTTLANGTGKWWIQTWNSSGYGAWSVAKNFNINSTTTTSNQYVSYMLNGEALLKEAKESAPVINISNHLATIASGNDFWINISPNAEWLLLDSTRLHNECGGGWGCLIYGKRDLSEFSVVETTSGAVIHPDAFSAISSDGKIIVAKMSINNRFDLVLSRRTGDRWSEPVIITTNSPSDSNELPAISANGQELLFKCGLSICISNIDGSNLTVLINPATRSELNEVGAADFDPTSNDIIFEGDDGSERIWRYNRTNLTMQLINDSHTNDNSPCVLSDGRVASLWLNRVGNTNGVHELKIMSATGLSHFMAEENTDISDIGIGCGGENP